MSEEEGIRQFVNQYGNLDPELESSFRKYITERDEPYYEAVNKRLLPSHLQDCIKEGVCPNKGYTPTPPTPTQKAEMNRDNQEWGASSMFSGQTLASVGGVLALGAGLTYGVGLNTFFNRIRSAETIQGGIRGKNVRQNQERGIRIKDEDMFEKPKGRPGMGGKIMPSKKQYESLYMIKSLVGDIVEKSIVPQIAKPERTSSSSEEDSLIPEPPFRFGSYGRELLKKQRELEKLNPQTQNEVPQTQSEVPLRPYERALNMFGLKAKVAEGKPIGPGLFPPKPL